VKVRLEDEAWWINPKTAPPALVDALLSATGGDPESARVRPETLDELGRIWGMTPAILTVIRPHLTPLGPPQPSAASLDPVGAACRRRELAS
jgi:hypothetical protein